MQYRTLGKTNLKISELSIGTWQVGGKWGSGFDKKNALEILNTAIDQGINFIDTADVYENRASEKVVGEVIRGRSEEVYIATKCGRFINPHVFQGYSPQVLRGFVETSLKNTGLERLDLIQLHCPPTEVYYRQEIFEEFDKLQQEGKIGHLGVSVEKVEEGIKAIEYPNVCTVQIIFNMMRQRPAELFFQEAKKKNIGIIARVPLASGLLTGKFSADTKFEEGDHRHFNRDGDHFDKGETFSGIDFDLGLTVVNKLKNILPTGADMVQYALRWVLMHEEVSCVIPGVSRVGQLHSNLKVLDLEPMSDALFSEIATLYDDMVRPSVHQRW